MSEPTTPVFTLEGKVDLIIKRLCRLENQLTILQDSVSLINITEHKRETKASVAAFNANRPKKVTNTQS